MIDPKIAEHRGRLVKTRGDGLLVEFGSVVDALRLRPEVQRAMILRTSVLLRQNAPTSALGHRAASSTTATLVRWARPKSKYPEPCSGGQYPSWTSLCLPPLCTSYRRNPLSHRPHQFQFISVPGLIVRECCLGSGDHIDRG